MILTPFKIITNLLSPSLRPLKRFGPLRSLLGLGEGGEGEDEEGEEDCVHGSSLSSD